MKALAQRLVVELLIINLDPRSLDTTVYYFQPGLAEIPAPVGPQDMMSQMRDYPFRQ